MVPMNSATPKAVVTDWTFPDLSVENEILTRNNLSLLGKQCKTESELMELVADANAVLTQFARISEKVIGAMKHARAIVRYGIGVDNVNLEAARARGIPVCNVPGYCIDEVADQTLAFILASTRQVVPNSTHLTQGKWGLPVPIASMNALRDLTVGVVGFGRIGREVVRRLVGFRCRVLVFDPLIAPDQINNASVEGAKSFEQLLTRCDVITLHCPSTPQTRRMFNAEAFKKLKYGALLINVARGDLIESQALVSALQSGQLAGAALDVFDPEPIPTDHPIRKMPNVILSAHIASVSPSAAKTLRETAANLAVKAIRGENLPNVVNGV